MKRGLACAVVAGLLLLTGCDGRDGQQIVDDRYHDCLAAGGSFSYHDTDFRCVIPTRAAGTEK